MNIMRMGASVKCPDDIGPSQYVILKVDPNCKAHLCHVGIFTCYCSALVASRSRAVREVMPEIIQLVGLNSSYRFNYEMP